MTAATAKPYSRSTRRSPIPLKWMDIVASFLGTGCFLALVLVGRWVPGWESAAAWFFVIGIGPPLLRALARQNPSTKLWATVADFWLLPTCIVAHSALKPLVDGLNPRLFDAYLARADLRLFGVDPGYVLGQMTPPWLNDILMLCYYSFFAWPVALGIIIYLRPEKRAEYEQYTLALCLLFGANFVFYLLVPAVGPRFFLAHDFNAPLPGLIAPSLQSMMMTPCFMKDCFPSGHTATTLMVLTYAYRHSRTFFWTMLPVGMGLIAATLVGRFHYGVDVLCAVPFMIATMSLANALSRVNPGRIAVVAPKLVATRQPARA